MSADAVSPISTYFRVCDGVRVRFADTKADSDITVLLLAPWPESLWAFRRIWRRVAPVGRVVAIDMPGFGHSEGRPELVAPDASGAFLARLIDEWGLGAPHVVGPDVGTAAALFLAARSPERVTSLTIGGGAVRFPIEAGGALKDIIEAPSLDVVRGLDARTNIGYAVEPVAARASEPEVHEDYVSAYDLGRFAESARFVRHYPEQNPVLGDLLPAITTPTQIVAGRDDDLVPWSNNEYLHDLLPNSEIHPLDAGHFAWEQAAEEYGRLVAEWVGGGYRRVGAAR
jgi:pimeloyl-ACP methyl ester carboxylesterase